MFWQQTYSSARVGLFARSGDILVDVDGSQFAEWIIVSDFIWGNNLGYGPATNQLDFLSLMFLSFALNFLFKILFKY